MKRYLHLFSFLFSTSLSMPLYAEDYSLYLKNHTEQVIRIVRTNGSYIVLPAQGFLFSARFRVGSEVSNYINGKKICSWVISTSNRCNKVMGLSYGPNAQGIIGCNVETLQRSPCYSQNLK
ncbi:MAG: hypothetical protein H0W64_02290 [Gammaproteobacteria bacterium]|nr:hypothetical protein [Gammaproteobacteria bacterium]